MKPGKWIAAGLAVLMVCSSMQTVLAAADDTSDTSDASAAQSDTPSVTQSDTSSVTEKRTGRKPGRKPDNSTTTRRARPDRKPDDTTATDSGEAKPDRKSGDDTNTRRARPDRKPDAVTSASRKPVRESTGDTTDADNTGKAEKPDRNSERSGSATGETRGRRTGGDTGAVTGSNAANTLTENASGVSYSSTADSENAVLVDGKTVTLTDVKASKTGSASGDSADFYGINAAVLAENGAKLTLKNAEIVTDGTHANGVFSYGSGTKVTVSDSAITTSGSNSGGLMTTGGGTTVASNLTVKTSGKSSAAIRSDRGGGTVDVTGGSYTASGTGSPAVYSTADITVKDAVLKSENSEAVVIEGGNSVKLVNVDATGNNAKKAGKSQIKNNVLIYQSMSGDAKSGEADFEMTGGKLTAQTGAMFHVTNTSAEIKLTNVELVCAADSSDFLIASADAWGTSGRNGGTVDLDLSKQVVRGNIVVDEISSVDLDLEDGSAYTGAITGGGTVNVELGQGCTWTLTGDSAVSSLKGSLSGINLNGHSLTVAGAAWQG